MGVVVLDVNIAESGYWYMWIQIAVLAVLRYRYSLFLVKQTSTVAVLHYLVPGVADLGRL